MAFSKVYGDFLKQIKLKYRGEKEIKLLCFPVFSPVLNKAFADNFIKYLQMRPGALFDFYIPGYEHTNVSRPDTERFELKRFVEFIRDIESESKWVYEGGNHIVFVSCTQDGINYGNVLDYNLDRMIIDGWVSDLIAFLKEICKFADKIVDDYQVTARLLHSADKAMPIAKGLIAKLAEKGEKYMKANANPVKDAKRYLPKNMSK